MPPETSEVRMSATERTAKSIDKLSDKGRRTRKSLIDAAQRVFERDGFIDTRITDIVAEAAAAHGTFYKYFTSKEQIFLAVLEDHQSAIEVAARASAKAKPRTAYQVIEASNRAHLEGYGQHWRLMETWRQAATAQKDINDLLEELTVFNIERTKHSLRRLQDQDAIASDLDIDLTATALNTMVMQFSARVLRNGPDAVDIDAAVRTLTDIWSRGISLKPGTPTQD